MSTEAYKPLKSDQQFDKLFNAKLTKAMCVITTEDDKILVRRQKQNKQFNTMLVPDITVTSRATYRTEIIRSAFLQETLGATALNNTTPLIRVGFCRPATLGITRSSFPVAVELEIESGQIEIPDNTWRSWASIEEVESFLKTVTPTDWVNVEDSHHALRSYIETMPE